MKIVISVRPGTFARLSRTLPDYVLSAERMLRPIILHEAQALSSGPYSRARLAAMGHPYARRNPRPPMHPGVINAQTGSFRRSWLVEAPRLSRGEVVMAARNTDWKADLLISGTGRMIPRPIDALLLQATEEAQEEAIYGALIRWLSAEG